MRRKGRILAINGVLVLALGGAAWGAYVLLWPSGSSNAASGVRTTAVTRTSVVETVSAAATVQSAYTASADFGTSGTVSEIDVKVGDVVSAGQQLAKLDATEANQQVTVAKSNLAAAQEDLDDAESASTTTTTGNGQTGASQQSATSLQAKVDQAELALQQAKDALAATTLKAPGAGTVTAINGSVGQRAGSSSSNGSSNGSNGSSNSNSNSSSSTSSSSSSGFVVLTDMTNLVVKANVAEIDVSKLKVGQDASVTINALPDTPVTAKVSQVDLTPTTSNNIVQFGVTLGLTQPPAGLRPGQSASVAITVARADDALAVPSAAVRTVGGQSSVTVLSGGQQVSRAVEVGVRSESLVQITSGLTDGEEVVLTLSTGSQTGGGNVQRPGGGGGGGAGPGGGGFQGGNVIPGGGGR
jgi:multidrug efflux pump subunit AcrA (membrane-fusion protein)